MIGAAKKINGSRYLTTPISGMFCHQWSTVNLPTKFVSISTHYEDMKGDT